MSYHKDLLYSVGDIEPSDAAYQVKFAHHHKTLKSGDIVKMVEFEGTNILIRYKDHTLHPLVGDADQYVIVEKI